MNGLQVKYKELLSLSVQQLFYQNGFCKKYSTSPTTDFVLVPTPECTTLMQRVDLVFRNTDQNAGMIVLGRVLGKNGGGDDLLRFPVRTDDKLSFWILLRNPAVFNFDVLPVLSDTSKTFYFSNQVADLVAPRKGLHISSLSAGVDPVSDRIKKSGSDYAYHHSATVAAGDAVVKHTLSGVEVEARAFVNQSGASDLFFDLRSLPLGCCKLFINHIDVEDFYHTGNDVPQGLFGVIEIALSPSISSNYRVVEPDRSLTATRPFYNLTFVNRSTLWRYTLNLEKNSPLYLEMSALPPLQQTEFRNQLNIVTNDAAITFTQTAVNADGTSFEFVSDNVIALQEKYISSSSVTKDTLSLTLKKYIGNADPAKEAPVKTNLQCPATGAINAINDPIIYSDIFLTL